MKIEIIVEIVLGSIAGLLTWYISKSIWMTILVPAIVVIVFGYAFSKRQAKREDEEGDSDNDKKSALTRFGPSVGKWAVIGIIIAVLLGAAGWVILEFDALEKRRARQNAFKIRSQVLEDVYNLNNGEYIPSDICNYSERNDIGPVIPPYDGSFPSWAEDIDLWPEDEITIRASLVGDDWKTNCGEFSPLGRFTTHTSGGTRNGGPYIAFFNKGNVSINVEKHGGAKLDFNVGCPTDKGWLRLDYQIDSFFINDEKII